MSVNPRHRRISKSNVETILNSLEENHRNAQSQRTSNSGSHFIPSGDLDENGFPTGQGTIIGGGAKGGGISPWVNDTTPPGKPEGLKVFSESSIIFVTWDGSLQGGTPPDFDHVSVYVDGVEKATFSAAGTYPTDSYEPDSVHKVTARSWDDAHDADGSSKPNGSELTDPMEVVVKSVVDVGQIEDAQNKAQEALDKIAGVSSVADKANSKADAALARGVELVRNPSFNPENGDLDGFGVSMGSSGAPAEPPEPYSTYGALTSRDFFSAWAFPLDKGRRYRFGAWVIADSDTRPMLSIGWRYENPSTHWDAAIKVQAKDATSWVWVENTVQVPDHWVSKDNSICVWLNIDARGADATGWWITGLTIRDVTESWNAQTTADGKNRIFTSANEPSHDGLAKGDLWMQLNADGHVTGIQVWNGSAFEDYVLMAQQVLVAGSVGTVSLSDGAVTADKVTASEALLEKLLVRKVKADEIDVGSLSAAIIQSGRFVTPDGLTGFDETGFWSKDKNGNILFNTSENGVKASGGFITSTSGNRIQLSQTLVNGTNIGGLQGIDDNAQSPYWLIWGSHDQNENDSKSSLFMGVSQQQPEFVATSDSASTNASVTAANVDISGLKTNITGDVRENDINHYHADRRILTWSSAWTGTPAEGEYIEANIDYNVITPGKGQWFIANMGARVGGTGEYTMGFRIVDNNTNNIVYNNRNITPPKNGGIDDFTYSNMFFLPNGHYNIKYITGHWGSVSISMDNDSYIFYDTTISPNAFARYATIVRI